LLESLDAILGYMQRGAVRRIFTVSDEQIKVGFK